MLDSLTSTAQPGALGAHGPSPRCDGALLAGWHPGLSILNLRGDPQDPAFRDGVFRALGLELPVQACTSVAHATLRIVWAGPDDWFVIGPRGEAAALESQLRGELAGQHVSVTDVSGGYTVLHLSGRPVRDVLAQGCPLDLHPRAFGTGSAAGSLFFKASVWLWQTDDAPVYEVLVRSSFQGYVWLMLERATAECGLVHQRFL